MTVGIFARYSHVITGNISGNIASISYEISGSSSTKSLQNISVLGNQGAVIAVEETFSISNNGDVSYDYEIELTLTDSESKEIKGYTLCAPTQNVFMLSSSSKIDLTNYTEDSFYFKKNGNTSYTRSDAPIVTGTLNIGETDSFTVLYYIDMTVNADTGLPSGTSLGEQVTLNYNVNCIQID